MYHISVLINKDRTGALCYNKSDVPDGYDWSGNYALGQVTKICPDEGNSVLCYPKPPSYYTYSDPDAPIPFENCGLGICHKPFLLAGFH